jgi:hypothetical protein
MSDKGLLYICIITNFVLERHWRTLKYVILKRKRKMRMDDLMKNLMIHLPDFMATKHGEKEEERIKDEILDEIIGRVKRGSELIKEATNYTVKVRTDKEIMCRFRNGECRKSHQVGCSESLCGYFVGICKGVGKCSCPDGPLLCKHLHGVVLLSGRCVEDWGLRMDSRKDVTEVLPGTPQSFAPYRDSDETPHEDGATYDPADFSLDGGQEEDHEDEELKATSKEFEGKLNSCYSSALCILQEAKDKLPAKVYDKLKSNTNAQCKELLYYGDPNQRKRIQTPKTRYPVKYSSTSPPVHGRGSRSPRTRISPELVASDGTSSSSSRSSMKYDDVAAFEKKKKKMKYDDEAAFEKKKKKKTKTVFTEKVLTRIILLKQYVTHMSSL